MSRAEPELGIHMFLVTGHILACQAPTVWLCSAVHYSAVQWSAMLCNALQCSIIHYSTFKYSTIQSSTVEYSTMKYSDCRPALDFPGLSCCYQSNWKSAQQNTTVMENCSDFLEETFWIRPWFFHWITQKVVARYTEQRNISILLLRTFFHCLYLLTSKKRIKYRIKQVYTIFHSPLPCQV